MEVVVGRVDDGVSHEGGYVPLLDSNDC